MKTKCPPKPLWNFEETYDEMWRRVNMVAIGTYEPRVVRRMAPIVDERDAKTCFEEWCVFGAFNPWDYPETSLAGMPFVPEARP